MPSTVLRLSRKSATESLVIRQDHGPTHVRLRAGETSPFLLGAEAPEFSEDFVVEHRLL